MDVKLIAKAMRRNRIVVLLGVFASVALAVLAFVSVSFAGGKIHVNYRQSIQYGTTATLYVTQAGFPDGAAVPQFVPNAPGSNGTPVERGDPIRLSTLTSFLAQLAASDAVARSVFGGPRPDPAIESVTVTQLGSDSSQGLPFLAVRGQSFDKARALYLTNRASSAFINYLKQRQEAAGIPESDRIVVDLLNRPEQPTLVAKRSLKLPIVVLLAGLCATVGAALVVDNFRRSKRAVKPLGEDEVIERLPAAVTHLAEGSQATGTSGEVARRRASSRVLND